jgi:hypothetical protein
MAKPCRYQLPGQDTWMSEQELMQKLNDGLLDKFMSDNNIAVRNFKFTPNQDLASKFRTPVETAPKVEGEKITDSSKFNWGDARDFSDNVLNEKIEEAKIDLQYETNEIERARLEDRIGFAERILKERTTETKSEVTPTAEVTEAVTTAPEVKIEEVVTPTETVTKTEEVVTEPTAKVKEQEVVVDGNDLILKHGTPHDFDKFQLEKIGTGEGAQAFGYGLYFTDGSKIAEGYARKLSKDKTGLVYEVRIKNGATKNWSEWRDTLDQDVEDKLYNSLTKEEKAEYQKHLDKAFYPDSPNYDMNYEKDYTGSFDELKRDKYGLETYEKPSAVGNIYSDLKDAFGQEKATEIFKRAGIDGIKYKSRRGFGDNYNYVVFDPNSIEIIKKEAKVETKAQPTLSKKDQEEAKILENDLDYYTRQMEDAQEQIDIEKSNFKEEKERISQEKAKVRLSKMSKDKKADKLEELDAELSDIKDDHDDLIEQYKDDIQEAKSELKRINNRKAKLEQKAKALVAETKAEPTTKAEEKLSPRVEKLKNDFVESYNNIPEKNTQQRTKKANYIASKESSLDPEERKAAELASNEIYQQRKATQEAKAETKAQPVAPQETTVSKVTEKAGPKTKSNYSKRW